MPCPAENAALAGKQKVHVPRADKIIRLGFRIADRTNAKGPL
jgi:hypothetical protein